MKQTVVALCEFPLRANARVGFKYVFLLMRADNDRSTSACRAGLPANRVVEPGGRIDVS